jgi:GNAT superfamily N-acetyltransferase
MALGRRMHEEVWYSYIPFNENRVAASFYDLMMNKERHFCRVAVANGVIVGAIAGARIPYWFSTAAGVFDQFLFVDKPYRGTLIGVRLWREMLAWSRQVGALELTHGVGTCSTAADRFFRGLGMHHVGGIYKLPLAEQPVTAPPIRRRSLAARNE